MFDKKENSPPEKPGKDTDEEFLAKQQQEAIDKLKDAPPAKIKCNCHKQFIDPTKKGKPCPYCGGLVG